MNRLANLFNVSVDCFLGRSAIKNPSLLHIKENEAEYNIYTKISEEIDNLSL